MEIYRNESTLLHGLRSGCADAVEYWFKKYEPKLKKYVSSRVDSEKDVDELVQEIFVNCLKDLPLFRGDSGIFTWMQGVAHHEVADYYRKRYAKKAITFLPLNDLFPQHAPRDAQEVAEKVRQVISQMTQEHRELLMLKYIDGKKVQDIAQYLGKTAKAVESDLFRARQVFRELYVELE